MPPHPLSKLTENQSPREPFFSLLDSCPDYGLGEDEVDFLMRSYENLMELSDRMSAIADALSKFEKSLDAITEFDKAVNADDKEYEWLSTAFDRLKQQSE